MNIAFVAMSGVRVQNPELLALGLTLPSVIERARTIAALPTLSLLTLAALTPADVEIQYVEIADVPHDLSMFDGVDLAAISSLSAQIEEAYALADRLRARGVRVVMGGLHVTAEPDEASEHADAVAVGEGELTWPRIVADFRAGALASRYAPAIDEHFDLSDAPLPRFDLLDVRRYNRLTVQTSRGCPHRCDFCAGSILLTPKYTVKPVERVIAEIRAIKRRWRRPFIEFADDNSFAMRGHYKQLLQSLAGEGVRWFTETDISIADDPELLDLMRDSGCREVLIGLESPNSGGLNGIELRRNWKLGRLPSYKAAIREIQSRGIAVNGCFILGLDGDDERVFESVEAFANDVGLFDVQITVLTPFPGTPLYDRLKRDGRLIDPRAWQKCTLFDVTYHPARMSARDLERGVAALAARLYAPAAVIARRAKFFDQAELRRHALSADHDR
ncbi:MAG: radical SAM protein [Phycisphaerales bacterium]|nr:radical SAM protein [Phycisphaerales bacterium]